MITPRVSVVLVNWNTRALTEAAVASLLRHERTALEVIIVDNASTDGSADALEARFPDAHVIRSLRNEGFARANNRGVKAARGDYALLLNSDTLFHEEVLPACLEALRTHGPAVVGCRLLNRDGTTQLSAEPFPRLGALAGEIFRTASGIDAGKRRALPVPGAGVKQVDWLCGAFLLLERETYLRLGGLSPEIFMYGEDTEFCWRAARQGIRSLYVPDVSITHLGGGAVDHASRRSLRLSDAGRLKSFALMRGPRQAFAFRLILMGRSVLRAIVWGVAGLLTGDTVRLRKAGNHGRQLFILAGLPQGGGEG